MLKPLEEVMHDLEYAMAEGSELGYRLQGDQIEIEQYTGPEGTKIEVVGYLTFRKAGTKG